MRLLTGAPVQTDFVTYTDKDELWSELRDDDAKGFLMVLSTEGFDDSKLNDCGVTTEHALSLLTVFPLYDKDGKVLHKMYMIRDPRGKSRYNRKFNNNDMDIWNLEFIEQIPFQINPFYAQKDHIFFVEHNDLSECFDMITIAHYHYGGNY